MTANASQQSTSWRGVAAEKAEEVSAGLAALLRERSRHLLASNPEYADLMDIQDLEATA